MRFVAKKYIKDLKHCFPVCGKEEKRYIRSLEAQIRAYDEEYPDVQREQLEEEFGRIPELVIGYMSERESDVLVHQLRKAKRAHVEICVGVLCAVVLWIFACVWQYTRYLDYVARSTAYTEIYIEDLGDIPEDEK